MTVTLFNNTDNKEVEVPFVRGDTVLDILERAGINPETVLVKKKDSIIPDDEELEDGDSITVMKIVSGG